MTREIEKTEINKLIEKYPDIFQDAIKPMSKTCMCWGITCGDGWKDTIDETCKQLTILKDITGIQVIADQVKEKFAGLRFYYHCDASNYKLAEEDFDSWQNMIENVISSCERKCDHVCDHCGESRWKTARLGHWMVGICDSCLEKEIKDRGEDFEKDFYANKKFNEVLEREIESLSIDHRLKRQNEFKDGEIEPEYEFSEKFISRYCELEHGLREAKEENMKKQIRINELENKLGV
jgi:hypothetical protein